MDKRVQEIVNKIRETIEALEDLDDRVDLYEQIEDEVGNLEFDADLFPDPTEDEDDLDEDDEDSTD